MTPGTTRGHRRIIRISSEHPRPFELAQQLLAGVIDDRAITLPLFAGGDDAPWPKTMPHAALGTTRLALVIDVQSNPRANDVAAMWGCVAGGGLIVFVNDVPDRLTCFWRRFMRLLRESGSVINVGSDSELAEVVANYRCPPDADEGGFSLTSDQCLAISAINRCAGGRARRPVVLKSDRGRGKSAAMGVAAAELLNNQIGNIVVTANSKSAVESLFRHAGNEPDNVLRITVDDCSLEFIPPDELLRSPADARLLLIDEAAALPAQLLQQLVDRYPRTVMATTVQGYEGSGRGFELRFSSRLTEVYPQAKIIELTQPVRWDEKDPAELFLNNALAMDVSGPGSPSGATEALEFTHIKGAELAGQEELLQQSWRLLVEAHHQTSPDDLQLLLDDADVSLLCARVDGNVVAVAMLRIEGGIDETLATAIAGGQRRLQGQRLPQGLAWYCQRPDLATRFGLRVVRIAVRDSVRRRGIGSALLSAIEEYVEAHADIDYVGASYAADAGITDFWLKAGYLPLRIGIRRDTGSGLHSLLVARSYKPDLQQAFADLQRQFAADFVLELGEHFRELEPGLVVILLAAGGGVTESDNAVVAAFAGGRGPYELNSAALWRWCVARLAGADRNAPGMPLLVQKVLQRHDWKVLCQNHGLSGRKEAEAALRKALGALIDPA